VQLIFAFMFVIVGMGLLADYVDKLGKRMDADADHYAMVLNHLNKWNSDQDKANKATQKALDALSVETDTSIAIVTRHVDDLRERFESHRTALHAHEKIPRGRRR